jgi:DegV family protein with EDD domain
MTNSVQQIKEIDGKQLYYSFLAGAQRIFEHQKLLNKINVFPVADADTGTNLASTMRSIMDASIPTDNFKGTAIAIADAALTGARGNSGIIFAQFLYGFSNEIGTNKTIDVQSFAESMKKAVNYAYEAIANPVEGTILTVIKDWADHLYILCDSIDDFIRLLVEAYQRALESLAGTTAQMALLARANVVDAGAKGFVYFLEGIKDFFTLGIDQTLQRIITEAAEPVELAEIPHEEITFRFCTEALIAGENIDKHALGDKIRNLVDSFVVAGSPQKLRIHIHTDTPAEVFAALRPFGNITYQKVDDMVMQNEIRFNRKSDIALVTDSGCDLPRHLIEQYQIQVVPFKIHFGETYFLDRITLMPLQFYAKQDLAVEKPSTTQPATKEFQNTYEYLTSHYNSVLAIHFSQHLSGTYSGSNIAAQEVSRRSGKRIDVVNSTSLSGGLGLLVLRVARALEAGETHEAVLEKTNDWKSKILLRVGLDSLKYIIRSGRVSPLKGFIANALDLKAVIAINKEGKTEVFSKSLTEKSSLKKVMNNLADEIKGKKVWEYAITHTNNPETVDFYTREMELLTGKKPVFVEYVTPGIVANTGPGTCITVMLE